MKKIKELIPYILIITLVILIRTFIITPVRVDGPSMEDTLENGDILLLQKFNNNYQRFDIVVLNYNNEKLVKRIIGLPGEKVAFIDNKLYINGKEVDEPFLTHKTENFSMRDIGVDVIPSDSYFVVGDNRENSLDSRYIGLINKSDIDGVVVFRLFPLKTVGKL